MAKKTTEEIVAAQIRKRIKVREARIAVLQEETRRDEQWLKDLAAKGGQ